MDQRRENKLGLGGRILKVVFVALVFLPRFISSQTQVSDNLAEKTTNDESNSNFNGVHSVKYSKGNGNIGACYDDNGIYRGTFDGNPLDWKNKKFTDVFGHKWDIKITEKNGQSYFSISINERYLRNRLKRLWGKQKIKKSELAKEKSRLELRHHKDAELRIGRIVNGVEVFEDGRCTTPDESTWEVRVGEVYDEHGHKTGVYKNANPDKFLENRYRGDEEMIRKEKSKLGNTYGNKILDGLNSFWRQKADHYKKKKKEEHKKPKNTCSNFYVE